MSTTDPVLRSDALLQAIYGSALEPSSWLPLHQQLLKNFRRDTPLTGEQGKFLDLVVGHVQRALHMAERRERLQWERQQVADFIDAVAPAVCVIRADGTIVGRNPAARRVLRAEVDTPMGTLLSSPEERQRFEAAVGAAVRDGHGASSCAAGAGELSLHVAVVPATQPPLFAVVLFAHDEAFERAIEQYAGLYRLTDKERRVLERAIRSRRLDGVAAAEGIGYHTARQHLAAVYAKTGASNQTELMAGVLRQSVLQEATRTQDTALLPHVRGLVHSQLIQVGTRGQPRQLCYAEYGAPQGKPVLYLHSLLGSRLELFVHDALLRVQGVRLIAVDRPGFGHTDFYEYASYGEYAQDIRRLLDALALDRVAILSCSAGTPHALACAADLGARISEVHCTGSMVPVQYLTASASPSLMRKLQARLFLIAPALLRPAVELMFRGQTVDSLYRMMLDEHSLLRSSALDAQFISQPEHLDHFVAFTIESLRQGPRAWGKEAALLNDHWRIDFEQVRCPVHFWHGEEDNLVPADMVQSFADELPQGRATVLDTETHLLIFRHLERILSVLQPTTAAAAGTGERVGEPLQ